MIRLEQVRGEMLERFERVDRRFAQNEQRLGRMEQRLAELTDRIEALRGELSAQLGLLSWGTSDAAMLGDPGIECAREENLGSAASPRVNAPTARRSTDGVL